MDKYYNKFTKTLIFPYTFNENLTDIPNDAEYIFFQDITRSLSTRSNFNKEIKEIVGQIH